MLGSGNYEFLNESQLLTELRSWLSPRLPEPPRGVLNVPIGAAVEGLIAWLHGKAPPNDHDLTSLINDVSAPLRLLFESHYTTDLQSLAQKILRSVEDVETSTFQDDYQREALLSSLKEFRGRLRDPGVLQSTWRALVDSCRDLATPPNVIAGRVHQLKALTEDAGHNWRFTAVKLRGVLADSRWEIEIILAAEAAATWEPEGDPQEPAGYLPQDRLDICERALGLPPASGECVYWMGFSKARCEPPILRVGPITFYDGQWWESVTTGNGNKHELPSETQIAPESAFYGTPENGAYVLARIALGQQSAGEAMRAGQANIRAVVRTAEFHSRSSWEELTGHALFIDGRLATSSPFFEPDAPPTVELMQDATSQELSDLSETLGAYLPISDYRLQASLDTVQWLVDAKDSDPAVRLPLSLRAVELVATWISSPPWHHFASTYLRPLWAHRALLDEITDDVYKGVHELNDYSREEFAAMRRELVQCSGTSHQVIDARVGIRLLPRLERLLPPDAGMRRSIEHLAQAARSGPASAALMDEHAQGFDTRLQRTKRCRNAILHGKPIEHAALRSVASFSYWLGAQALFEVIHALLQNEEPEARFRDNLERHQRAAVALRDQEAPDLALFWDRT